MTRVPYGDAFEKALRITGSYFATVQDVRFVTVCLVVVVEIRDNRGTVCPIALLALDSASRLSFSQIIFAPRHSSCTVAEQLFALFHARLRVQVDEGRWKFVHN